MSLTTHYVSAPAGELLLFLLELTHPSWPAPLRYAEDVRDWTVTLEDDEEATFPATGFEGEAGGSDDGGVDTRQLSVPDEDLVLWRRIEANIGGATPITAILRAYLSTGLGAPLAVVRLEVATPVQELDRSVRFEATTSNTMNREAPTLRFTAWNSPGLRR